MSREANHKNRVKCVSRGFRRVVRSADVFDYRAALRRVFLKRRRGVVSSGAEGSRKV